MPDLRLAGCQPRPLVGYLKALGLLRIVCRQADSSVRGRWRHGAFELRSELDENQLLTFLLEDYSPSPVLSPWNGRSGFYRRGNATAVKALERIRQSTVPRLAPFRALILQTRTVLADLEMAEKPSDESQKAALVRRLRREWPDDAIEWLDAAIVLTGEKPAFPPLLGSGGNDGSYDFSSNYMQAVGDTLLASGPPGPSKRLMATALLGGPGHLEKMALAHLSRDASPTNSPYGEADSLGNPWDLVLGVEGAMLLAAGAARRHGAAAGGTLVAPFTVYSTAAGYGSAVCDEKGRAEIWLPLWSQWTTHAEIANLVRESRAQVGRGASRRQARTGLDFARAAGELGVARGTDGFERYAILERAGQSSLAVPAGRVSVAERPAAEALRSIGSWLDAVIRFGRGDNCPSAIRLVAGQLEQACFQLASRGTPEDACLALEAMGAAEHTLARSRSAIEVGMRPLSRAQAAPWIEAANDGTAEFTLAAALASLRDRRPRSPALRDYLHGTRRATASSDTEFDPERRHAVTGKGVTGLLAAIHARRHLNAAARQGAEAADTTHNSGNEGDQQRMSGDGTGPVGLAFDMGTWCDIRIARLFVANRLDQDRVLRLLYGMVLLDHRAHAPIPRVPTGADVTVPIFDVLALAWMGKRRRPGSSDGPEPLGPRRGWAARLAAGAIRPVIADALLRLRMAGLEPILAVGDLLTGISDGSRLGPRLGAALLIRLRPTDIDRIARKLTISEEADNDTDHREETLCSTVS